MNVLEDAGYTVRRLAGDGVAPPPSLHQMAPNTVQQPREFETTHSGSYEPCGPFAGTFIPPLALKCT